MSKKLKSRAKALGTFIGITLGTAVLVYAASFILHLVFKVNIVPGSNPDVKLTGAIVETKEVVPGTEISLSPTVTNVGTENCYVFIRLNCATSDGNPIYSFTSNDVTRVEDDVEIEGSWTRVATDDPGELIYAYGSATEMSNLAPDEAVTLSGTVKLSVGNAVFNTLVGAGTDFSVSVHACAIGTDTSDVTPSAVYNEYIGQGGE